MAMNLEYTDTFGGEANYSWVRRAHIPCDELSRLALIRRAKAWAGLSGVPCKVSCLGDGYEIMPRRMATVLFVSWSDIPEGEVA
jgi:hypothetical protein